MTEREALWAAVLAAPDDDTPRLVYADRLEEDGERERAEFVRLQCELHATNPAVRELVEACPTRVWEAAEYARTKYLLARTTALLEAHAAAWLAPAPAPHEPGVFGRDQYGWAVAPGQMRIGDSYVPVDFRRGFVDRVICRPQVWPRIAPAAYWHPDQRVALPRCATCHGLEEDERGRWKDKHGHDFWVRCGTCKGKTHGPRPFVPTAHPITEVVLTDVPGPATGWNAAHGVLSGDPKTGYRSDAWPGVTFRLPGA